MRGVILLLLGPRNKDVFLWLPGPHLRHLVSHLAQRLGCAQDVSALLPSTQLTHFPSFIEDLADSLLACVPWKHTAQSQRINYVRRHNEIVGLRTWLRQNEQIKGGACRSLLPGWAFGSLSQFLAWAIFESISPRALFMASVSFGIERQNNE